MTPIHFACKNAESPITAINISIMRNGETNMQILCANNRDFNSIIHTFLDKKFIFIHKNMHDQTINVKGALYTYKHHEKIYNPENMCIKALQLLIDANIAPVFLNKVLTNFPTGNNSPVTTTNTTKASLSQTSMFKEKDFVHIENNDIEDFTIDTPADPSANETRGFCRIS